MAQNSNIIIPQKAIDGITQTNTEIIKLDESTFKFITTIEQLNEQLKKGNLSFKELQSAQKSTATNTKKLTELEKEHAASKKALAKEKEKGLKIIQRELEKEAKLEAALRKEIKSEDDLIKKTNALVAVRRKLDVTTDSGRKKHAALTKEINNNTVALKKSDAAINRNQRNVGKYSTALKGLGSQFLGALGITAGVYMFVSALKSAFSTLFEFGQKNATLASILSKTREEIADLTQSAIDYGKVTKFTASEVSELQIQLAKLGFTMGEIQVLTGDVLNLAEATGGELGAAAKVTGIALKAFGLSANDAGEVTAALAIATTKSALAFEDYETILSTVGPVAKAYGFSLADILALQGKLRDSGFDASKSATALRNILLNLADANGDLAKTLGGSVRNLEDLIPALIQLRSEGVDLNTTLQLTDKRSVAAFNSLLEGADDVIVLRDALIGANEQLAEMVGVKTDNTIDAMARMGSAWDGVVLTFRNSEGFFTSFFNGIANTLNTLSDQYVSGFDKYILLLTLGVVNLADEETKARAEVLANIKKSNLEQLGETRKLYEQQARDGDAFAIEVMKRTDSQLSAIVEANRQAAKRKEQTELDSQAVIDAANKKATTKINKEEEKRIAAARKYAEEYKVLWKSVIDSFKRETGFQVSKEAAAALEADLDFALDIYDEDLANWVDSEKGKTKATEEEQAKRKAIIQTSLQGINAIGIALFQNQQNRLELESAANSKQKAYELELAGDNQEQINAINVKFDKKEAELKTKQAKADKLQALFSIGLSTAMAIASASPVVPLMIFAGVVGAIQLALAAASPIPQFYKGTDSAPRGIISVAEKGYEIAEKDGKRVMFDSPTITSGMEGAKIYTHNESKRLMRGQDGSSIDVASIVNSNLRVERAIMNQPRIVHDKAHRTITERKGLWSKTYLNRKLR